ncbi:hypothetical protein [Enterobacter ludwigii]|uniref:hypothetical protein n=1 Tax=Enterobacter TaxID=547 RepID=UPI003855DF6A
MTSKSANLYSPDIGWWSVRMFLDQRGEYRSERERINDLNWEVWLLPLNNDILRLASAYSMKVV